MKTSSKEEKIILAEKLLKDAWDNMDELHCGSAMPIADHAVTIYRSLAQDEPLLYDPMLAYSYNTLSMAYSFMNLLSDAEDACVRAVFFARKSYKQSPDDEYLRQIAKYLYAYGYVLQREEKLEKAYKVIHEACCILTILKEKGTDYLPDIHKELLIFCDAIDEQIDSDYWNHQLESLK